MGHKNSILCVFLQHFSTVHCWAYIRIFIQAHCAFLHQLPLGATSCSKCHCCLGWWVQGRRKSPPVWVLAFPGLLCGGPLSLTASRHNWDCRWTSWPLSWSRTHTHYKFSEPQLQSHLISHTTKQSCLYELPAEAAVGRSVFGAWR